MQNKSRIFWLFGLFVAAITFIGAGCLNFNKSSETKSTETPKVEEKTEVTLDKASYETGEDMIVTYDIVEDLGEQAWIGIVPANTVHDSEDEADAVDTDYEYLEESQKGTKDLNAPDAAGSYNVRIYSGDGTEGKELSSIAFTVVASTAASTVSFDIDKQEYAPEATITVTFYGADKLGSTAWVGVVPSDIEHGDETVNDENDTSYAYLSGKDSGTVALTAPSEPGSYDVRLNGSDSTTGAKEIKYVSFTVVE
jgi:hypothetical protein